eukprot:jgi/Hompol1/6134/HPOL_004839-RA
MDLLKTATSAASSIMSAITGTSTPATSTPGTPAIGAGAGAALFSSTPSAESQFPKAPTAGVVFACESEPDTSDGNGAGTGAGACGGCSTPCSAGHEQLPEYLAKKIDGDVELDRTLKAYSQHLLVRVGSGTRWSEKLEDAPDSFVARLDAALAERKLPFRSLLTAFERPLSANPAGQDAAASDAAVPESSTTAQVVLFPQQIVFDSVDINKHLPLLLDYISASSLQTSWPLSAVPQDLAAGAQARLWDHKATIFVCTHKRRDKRCGVAGPMIVSEFDSAIKKHGLAPSDVGLYGTSHIGGHKFAGCMIVYHPDKLTGALVGDWYGRVKTCHVDPILEHTVKNGEVIRDLWRGRMSAHVAPSKPTQW